MPIEHFSFNKITRLLPIAIMGAYFSSSVIAASLKSELEIFKPMVFHVFLRSYLDISSSLLCQLLQQHWLEACSVFSTKHVLSYNKFNIQRSVVSGQSIDP